MRGLRLMEGGNAIKCIFRVHLDDVVRNGDLDSPNNFCKSRT